MDERIVSKVIHYNLPRLMRHSKMSGLIVLFTARRVGIVVASHYNEDGDYDYEVGYAADDWAPIESGEWESFAGIVELKNGG